MLDTNEKIKRIIEVVKMYYIQNMTQNEIAKELAVSRPLISKLLSDAIEMGIVTINVNYPTEYNVGLIQEIKETYGLKEIYVISQSSTAASSDIFLAEKAEEIIRKEVNSHTKALGLGWGSSMVQLMEVVNRKSVKPKHLRGKVVPLTGSINSASGGYTTSDIVQVSANKTGLSPRFLFAPAFLKSKEEQNVFLNSDNYKAIAEIWGELDTMIVGIHNYPGIISLKEKERFSGKLDSEKAVGSVLSYYYDKEGKIIQDDNEFPVQIPLEDFKKCKKRIGIASPKINKKAIIGALKAGLFTHLIISNLTAEKLV